MIRHSVSVSRDFLENQNKVIGKTESFKNIPSVARAEGMHSVILFLSDHDHGGNEKGKKRHKGKRGAASSIGSVCALL